MIGIIIAAMAAFSVVTVIVVAVVFFVSRSPAITGAEPSPVGRGGLLVNLDEARLRSRLEREGWRVPVTTRQVLHCHLSDETQSRALCDALTDAHVGDASLR